ncbi:MAG: ABC transporter permease [Anaerolineae bacterium]
MNPLSIWTYYARNKRKAIPILAILALAVFGISFSQVLTGDLMDAVRAFVTPYHKFFIVYPNYNKKYSTLDSGLRAEIRRSPHLAEVIPVQVVQTIERPLGIQQTLPVFAVDDAGLQMLYALSGDTLIAGRMPVSHENEIVLHEMVARTRGLWVGSQIGREVDSEDAMSGKWTVVGILGGETVLNLAPLSRVTQGRPAGNLLLIPRPGEMDALVAEIKAAAGEQAIVESADYLNGFIDRVLDQFNSILSAINLVVVVVLSLGVGLLNMIYFRQRISEFAILAGIGYSRLFLIRRVTLESIILTTAGWLIGIALAGIIYQVLNLLLFDAQGTPLVFANVRTVSGTLPVPIFVWLFSTATIIWQLRRLDPVAIIDRRD